MGKQYFPARIWNMSYASPKAENYIEFGLWWTNLKKGGVDQSIPRVTIGVTADIIAA